MEKPKNKEPVKKIRNPEKKKKIDLLQYNLQKVREKIWKMQKSEDLVEVAIAIKESLEEQGVPFQNCGINVVDISKEPPEIYSYNLIEKGEWASRIDKKEIITGLWRGGETVYRKDLEKEDIYGEKAQIEEKFESSVRSVVDVPFSHGTLAISSSESEAFSESDIINLEEMAQVLSEGFKRMDDLINLERYTKELENEIADRGKAKEALKESESRLRQIIDLVPHYIFARDEEGRFIFANKASAEAFGKTVEEMPGSEFRKIFTDKKEKIDKILEDDREVIRSGKPKFIPDYEFVDSNGKLNILQTTKIPFKFSGSDKPAVLGISVDVTEQKQLENQLILAQKMESVGRMAGGIAHDFNNMLTAIMGNAEIILMLLSSGAPGYSEAQEIIKTSQRAADLTCQILTFSRHQIIELKVINLNATLLEMNRMFQRLIGEDIELAALPASDLWTVKVDPGQIEQVITNLVVNAGDSMPGGGKLTIKTANVILDDEYAKKHLDVNPGEYVMMSISDTGVGMDKETMSHIFEPFFTTKEVGKGTGLGLSTCYGIIKNSGGSISVYSEPGLGTTVKIYLPHSAGEAPHVMSREEYSRLPGGTETVLVVEDEPSLLRMVGRILKSKGYVILEASNGEEALKVTKKQARTGIQLLLTDVVMPRMGGRELTDHLRDIYPELKVLYMSGYTDNSIFHHGVLDEGVEFIQKPFSPENLVRRVRKVLDK